MYIEPESIMRIFLLTMMGFVTLGSVVLAQKPDTSDRIEDVFHKPEPIGGFDSLYAKFEYPERAKQAGVRGIVIVQFFVTLEGEVDSLRVTQSVGHGCDEAALQVMKSAKYKPGSVREALPTEPKPLNGIRMAMPFRCEPNPYPNI
jgi:TonB family protein